MGKTCMKRVCCLLLCALLLVPGAGTAFGQGVQGTVDSDTWEIELHPGNVLYASGSVSSGDRSNLKLDEVWKTVKGKGVNVAVIDGGANLNDPAIKSRVKGVYNAKTGSTSRSDISNDSHGTSCAKILVGVAPKVNLYIIQAGSGGYIYGDQVERGLAWAKSKNCRVISMSFGKETYSQSEYNAINNLYTASSNSALVCASGGNSGKKEYHYAASYDNTLSVGAAKYSSGKKQYVVIPKGTYNDRMDVVAPGGSTSAAAPFAAGVAALLFQARPSMTAKECRDILNSTAKDLGAKGYDPHYGNGLIQPYSALKKVMKINLNPVAGNLSNRDKNGKALSGKLLCTWKRNSKATGYEIWIATDGNFKKNVVKKVIKKNKTTSCTFTKLKKGKKYYMQIRVYQKKGGATFYSDWKKSAGRTPVL